VDGGSKGCNIDDHDGTSFSIQDVLGELAVKHRMNTGIRKSIFCAIMASTDYEDAFEKLMTLNLK